MNKIILDDIILHDIRFDTSSSLSGSDARSKSPDYSCVYITLKTNQIDLVGNSLVFTLGKGNQVIKTAIHEYIPIIKNKTLQDIIENFKEINNKIINDEQMCWIGPEKGASHMAAGGLINGLWDLWAKYEKKPLWKLISDLDTRELINLLDFNYMDPLLEESEAIKILNQNINSRNDRIEDIIKHGLEAYTTSIGWSGYTNKEIIDKCNNSLEDGFKNFKMKVGSNIEIDVERASLIRKYIGWNKRLMMDANGIWDYTTALKNLGILQKFNPYWIEEPTHPDDVMAHLYLKSNIHPIKIATGEQCPNKVMFKQYIQLGGFSILQTDINRLASVSEWLVVAILAKKYGYPICTHAGGVGLCQMAAHLAAIDYICIANSTEDRITEYVDHLQEHFVNPVKINNGSYALPSSYGLGLELKQSSIENYSFPNGKFWKRNIALVKQKLWNDK